MNMTCPINSAAHPTPPHLHSRIYIQMAEIVYVRNKSLRKTYQYKRTYETKRICVFKQHIFDFRLEIPRFTEHSIILFQSGFCI